jgi:hypothetical protein
VEAKSESYKRRKIIMRKTVFFTIGILTVLLMLVSGCTSGTSRLEQTSAIAGRLIVNITDAPSAPEIDEIWLTITGVQVHVAGDGENDGEWKDLDLIDDGVAPPDESRFDLLKLVNGSQAELAVGFLDPGKYTQLRMDVKLVELHLKGSDPKDYEEAKLPSTVLKFVHPFEIVNGGDTELLFDFDALKSVNETGNGKYMFKPVIKVATINQPFQITSVSLPNGVVGSYTAPALATSGGVGPYTWSLTSITPVVAGNSLIIDVATGAISGTFAADGDYTLTVKVVDSSSSPQTATKSFNIEIAASGALQIITTSLSDGTVSVPYADTNLVVVGGTSPYIWEITSVTGFPAGLVFTNGLINGTPTASGDFNFTVKVTDSLSTNDTQEIIIRINEAS